MFTSALLILVPQKDTVGVRQLLKGCPALLQRHTSHGATPLGLAAAVGGAWGQSNSSRTPSVWAVWCRQACDGSEPCHSKGSRDVHRGCRPPQTRRSCRFSWSRAAT
jgi:hypothetical protein